MFKTVLCEIHETSSGIETAIPARSDFMTSESKHKMRSLPTADYSAAIGKAVQWLGHRYLLARPINRTMSGAGTAADAAIK